MFGSLKCNWVSVYASIGDLANSHDDFSICKLPWYHQTYVSVIFSKNAMGLSLEILDWPMKIIGMVLYLECFSYQEK